MAYECDRCPLPRFDPGPELRTAVRLHSELFSPAEGPVHEWRWQRFLAAEPDPQLVDDVLMVHGVVMDLREETTERRRGRT